VKQAQRDRKVLKARLEQLDRKAQLAQQDHKVLRVKPGRLEHKVPKGTRVPLVLKVRLVLMEPMELTAPTDRMVLLRLFPLAQSPLETPEPARL